MYVYALIFLIHSILRLGGCSVGVFFAAFESLGRIFFFFSFLLGGFSTKLLSL